MARIRLILVLLVAIAAGGGLAYGTYSYVKNMPASAACRRCRRGRWSSPRSTSGRLGDPR